VKEIFKARKEKVGGRGGGRDKNRKFSRKLQKSGCKGGEKNGRKKEGPATEKKLSAKNRGAHLLEKKAETAGRL